MRWFCRSIVIRLLEVHRNGMYAQDDASVLRFVPEFEGLGFEKQKRNRFYSSSVLSVNANSDAQQPSLDLSVRGHYTRTDLVSSPEITLNHGFNRCLFHRCLFKRTFAPIVVCQNQRLLNGKRRLWWCNPTILIPRDFYPT